MAERICANCGKTVYRKHERMFPSKDYACCNKACLIEYHRKKTIEEGTGFEIPCGTCGRLLRRMKSTIKNGNAFCNRKCMGVHLGKIRTIERVWLVCDQCSKEFETTPLAPSQLKRKPKHRFCSISCNATYHFRSNCLQRKSRSKIEVWIETKLKEIYPNVEFIFNSRKDIGSELDIFIPQLKVGIEINGPWHYISIHGQERLEATQRKDLEKSSTCREMGISFLTVDISSQRAFSPKTSQKFLDIIVEHIEKIRNQLKEQSIPDLLENVSIT